MIGRRFPLAVLTLVLSLLALPSMASADGTITGSVRTTSGVPLPGVLVGTTLYGKEFGLMPATIDASGRFTQTLPEGKYLLLASDPDNLYASRWWPNAGVPGGGTPITVVDGATVSGLDLQLDLGGKLVGTIRDAAGKAVPGAILAFTYQGAAVDEMVTGKDGKYEYTPMGAGTWTVDVTGPIGSTLPPIRAEVTIAAGQSVPGDFVLGAPAGQPKTDPTNPLSPKVNPGGPAIPNTTGGVLDAAPKIVAPLKGRVAVTKGIFTRAVQCAAGSRCVATISVVTAKKVRSAKTGRRAFVVVAKGKVDTTTAASTVSVKLTAAGKKLLRKGGRRGLKVTLRAAPAASTARPTSFPMTLVARG